MITIFGGALKIFETTESLLKPVHPMHEPFRCKEDRFCRLHYLPQSIEATGVFPIS
jgi:hypothetical protein